MNVIIHSLVQLVIVINYVVMEYLMQEKIVMIKIQLMEMDVQIVLLILDGHVLVHLVHV